jgi:hypothetical protein
MFLMLYWEAEILHVASLMHLGSACIYYKGIRATIPLNFSTICIAIGHNYKRKVNL